MGNTFGNFLRLTTFGESHGSAVGGILDGLPSGVQVSEQAVQAQLDRRRPGQSDLSTPRKEADRISIHSGIENGLSLGTPLGFTVANENRRPKDYAGFRAAPRPSHADFTYRMRYGAAASSGGGRASARETISRVAGGAIAEQLLGQRHGTEIVAWVSSVSDIDASAQDFAAVTRAQVDGSIVRCPDEAAAGKMITAIEQARDAGDSLGGIITCVCRNIPAGWGDPVFDKVEAGLARAMLSIPATKGFDFGSGFAGTRMRGSQHNDPFTCRDGRLVPATNNSGGIQGGITNGAPVYFRVAFKPVATIRLPQQTVDYEGNPVTIEGHGRHDPCVLPRAVAIVESMAALVLADAALAAEVK